MVLVKQWIYEVRPEADVSPANYRYEEVEQDLTPVRGEVVVEGAYWSVDPYMRIQQSSQDTWEAPHPTGEVQGAAVVGRVTCVGEGVTTLKVGDWVETYMGWRSAGLRAVADCRLLDADEVSPSTALHVLGMPGRIAYFGLLEAGKPRPGETLVVSGAAGAVGSIVGQIGKLAGLRVIGVVGSDEKARWITEELGFDAAINYRQVSDVEGMKQAFAEHAPDGVDIYYDNTGGVTTDAFIESMKLRARIIICGQISQYQSGLEVPNLGPRLLHHFLYKRATMTGVLARDYTARMDEMLKVMGPWVRDGKIRYSETVIDGFETLPEALCGLFTGANTGKMIVKA
ncbi:NADP-dependent oxidoreductase [Pseudovibrio sp. SCP19]|uniref:NADP-dependent oxidoreductase n=1 Tax=Pseudovibrio sp. SCP19 TaxID=3141374 RepID=UPI003337819D